MSQACSGQLMSHNTYDNIVKNKGNIDYCIEVHFLAMILQILSPAISVSLVILLVHACAKANYVALRQQSRQFLTEDLYLFFFSNLASLRTASGA